MKTVVQKFFIKTLTKVLSTADTKYLLKVHNKAVSGVYDKGFWDTKNNNHDSVTRCEKIFIALIRNTQTPENILKQIAETCSQTVLRQFIRNTPKLSIIPHFLLNPNLDETLVCEIVARNEEPEIAELFKEYPDEEIRMIILYRRNTPVSVLKYFLKNETDDREGFRNQIRSLAVQRLIEAGELKECADWPQEWVETKFGVQLNAEWLGMVKSNAIVVTNFYVKNGYGF